MATDVSINIVLDEFTRLSGEKDRTIVLLRSEVTSLKHEIEALNEQLNDHVCQEDE